MFLNFFLVLTLSSIKTKSSQLWILSSIHFPESLPQFIISQLLHGSSMYHICGQLTLSSFSPESWSSSPTIVHFFQKPAKRSFFLQEASKISLPPSPLIHISTLPPLNYLCTSTQCFISFHVWPARLHVPKDRNNLTHLSNPSIVMKNRWISVNFGKSNDLMTRSGLGLS